MKAAMVTERAQAEENLGKVRAQVRLEEVWISVAEVHLNITTSYHTWMI